MSYVIYDFILYVLYDILYQDIIYGIILSISVYHTLYIHYIICNIIWSRPRVSIDFAVENLIACMLGQLGVSTMIVL